MSDTLSCEVDHLTWISRLWESVEHRNPGIVTQIDPNKCAFGTWLQGFERRKLEAVTPGIAELLTHLEGPHTKLHTSARQIVSLLQDEAYAEAQQIFESETQPFSSEVLGSLRNIRLILEKSVSADRKLFPRMVDDSILFAIMLLLLCAVWSVLVTAFATRSLSGPLRKVVDIGQRVMDGDLHARLHMSRGDEVGLIATAINSMLDSLCAKIEEGNVRLKEMGALDRLLGAVNKAAHLLLREHDNFELAVWNALRLIGSAAGADRAYIWRDWVDDDGRLYCDQVHEWSENVAPIQQDALAHRISYDDVIPCWKEHFARGASVRGLVRLLSESERAQLEPQGILSVMTTPIILDAQVWGFIGLDDCHKERIWTDAEEDILRAAGILIAAAIRRHNLTRDLQEAKDRAEDATRAKSEFLARMSHEIRTPMNAVLGLAYIGQQGSLTPKQRELFAKIQSAANNLLTVINGILDFSKIEARKLELEHLPFSLRQSMSSVFDILLVKAVEKNIALEGSVEDDVPDTLVGDAPRLRQVLINLGGNAVKFTDQGSVRVRVEQIEQKPDGATLRFTVSDTGIGIDEQALKRLFKPFSQSDESITRRFGGTGLGLVISRELIEMMGGELMVSSSAGQGSVFAFTLTLPRTCEEQPQPAIAEDGAPPNLAGRHILVVDDNDINQLIARALLEEAGATVSVADNGAQAIEAVRGGHFDLVLMDVQMPVMDGLEATRRIREMSEVPPDLPIVAVTAHAMSSDYAKSLAAGMNDHITKPIEPSRLYAMLVRWIFLKG